MEYLAIDLVRQIINPVLACFRLQYPEYCLCWHACPDWFGKCGALEEHAACTAISKKYL